MRTDKDSLLELLKTLVSYPTETGVEKPARDCFEYIAEHLRKRGMRVDELSSNGFPVICSSTMPDKAPKVLLQAHLDVVPANEFQFSLAQKNGKFYGRGVFDMKFAAACYLYLVDDLQHELDNYDFGMMFTCDEEIAGGSVADMLAQGFYDSTEVCVLPDAGHDWEIEASCNGMWFVELIASGHTAHGSRPWEGDNAIDRLIEGLAQIRNVFGGEVRPGESSLNVGQIEGGSAANQVPSRALAKLDMRFKNMSEYETLRPRVNAIASELGLALNTLAVAQPIQIDLANRYVVSFVEMAAKISGKEIKTCHSLGGSDASSFTESGIPTILMRPGGGGAHSDNEWLLEEDFIKYYELIRAFVTKEARVNLTR